MRAVVVRFLVVLVLTLASCGDEAVTGPTGASPSAAGADPDGVLLWRHDGTRTWPPTFTALPLAGGDPLPVELVPENAIDRDWSPDLTRMVWLEQVRGDVPGARVVLGRPDGTSSVVVGELRHWDDYRGRSWSPDGTLFAYAAYSDDGTSIQVVEANSGSVEEIYRWDTSVHVDVDWSPDGSELAVAVPEGPDAGVSTLDRDGGELQRVSSLSAWRVRWSPLGDDLAVEALEEGHPIGIYVVGSDGSGERRLSPPDVVEARPVWSPDGAWIAFASERDVDPSLLEGPRNQPLIDPSIFVISPDGTDLREIVAPVDEGWTETWDWFTSWPPPDGGGVAA